jgi:DegV family protein with EDD domain
MFIRPQFRGDLFKKQILQQEDPMKTKILTDSCCDLSLSYIDHHKEALEVIGIPVQMEGKDFIDDLGRSYNHTDFYNALRRGVMPTTSQINTYRFEKAFHTTLETGKEVIYLGFSSGLSGTYNAAFLARNLVLEDRPDAPLYVVDTLSASIGLGVLVLKAVAMAEAGAGASEIAEWILQNRFNANHWFGVDDLIFLKNGGRIGAATAAVGSVLNVKPILTMDTAGILKPYNNVRGRKKVMSFLSEQLKKHFIENTTTCAIIGHGDCEADAEHLKEILAESFPQVDVQIMPLSMTIASHVGPNMLALAFLGETREANA